MSDLVTAKPGDSIFLKYILSRINRNQNVLIAMTGGTGSGKTYSSIKLGEEISKITNRPFNEEYITFKPIEFMEMINSDKMFKGSVIILDEAGVSVNARKWQSQTNILMGYVTQTFRHKNYIVIFNVPDFSFIDKTLRKMFHIYIETVTIDYKEKVCWTKPFLIQSNQRTGDLYFKYLRYQIKGRGVDTLGGWGFSLPSTELLKNYERKKTYFTNQLNKEVLQKLKIDEIKSEDKKKLTERQDEIYKLNQSGNNLEAISKMIGVSKAMVSKTLIAIEKKGYEVNRFHIRHT